MFEYEGQQYTKEEVEKAAKEKNLSVEDYVKQFEITPIEEPSLTLQNLMPTPGKTKPTTPDAVVEEEKASDMVSPSEDGSLGLLPPNLTVEEKKQLTFQQRKKLEREGYTRDSYDKLIKKQEEKNKQRPDVIIQDLSKIDDEIKSWAGEDMQVDPLDSPKRILKYNELVDKRKKLETKLKKEIGDRGTFNSLYQALKKGDRALGEMILSIPSFVYQVGSLFSDPINEALGLPKTDLEKFEKQIGTRSLLDDLIEEQNNLSTQQQVYKDLKGIKKGIGENFAKGNFNDAFYNLGEALAESAPVSLSLMMGGAAGLSRTALTIGGGVPLAAGEMRTQQEENPNQSREETILKSTLIGLSEGFFEGILGSGALGRVYGDIIKKEGVDVGKKTFQKGLVVMYEAALKKYGIPVSIAGEGFEEAATQVTQNLVNNRPITEGVTDAFITGVGGGGLYGAPINLTKGIQLGKNTLESINVDKIIKPTEYTNISQAFNPINESNISQIELSQTKGSERILRNQLKKQISKGEITKEEGDAILQNFYTTQGVANNLKPLKLDIKDQAITVQLLKEKDQLKKIIDQVGDPNLTLEQSERINEINKDLKGVGKKAVTQQIEKIRKATKDITDLDIQEFATNEETQAYIDKQDTDTSGVKGSEQQAFIVQRKDGSQSIVINREIADAEFAVAAPAHEALHAILYKTLKNNPETQKALGNALKQYIDNIDVNKVKNSNFAERLKQYKDQPENVQAEELITLFSDAILTEDIKFEESIFTKIGDVIRKILQSVFPNIKFNKGRDVYNFIKDYNKNIQKSELTSAQLNVAEQGATGSLITKPKSTTNVTSTITSSKSTLFEDIQKLVPNDIKTKQEFDNFVRSPQGAKLFNSIYEEGGAINSYIRQRATTPEESQKIIDNTVERVLNFNPESTRDDGGAVGVEGFTERIMADTRFAKLDAKKDLFKESERAKQEQQLDSPQAAQVAATESTPTETTKQQTSKLRRDLGIKQGDDLYNAVKQTAKEIFGKDLDNVELKKLKAIVNKKARGSDIFKDVAKLMGTEKAIDPQFLNKNILNILKDLPVSDLVKLERGTKGKKIFTKTGPRLGPIAARKAVSEGLLPKNTNVNSGPRVSEKLPVTLEQAKEFFTQKRKAGLVGVIAENLIADAAPSVTKEIKILPKRRAEVLDVIDRDPELKFSISEGTQNILSKAQFDLGIKDVNALLNNYDLSSVFTVKTVEDIPKYIKALKEYVFPLLPKQAFFGPSGGTAFTSSSKILGNNFGSLKDADGNTIYENGKPKQNPVWAEFTKQIKALKDLPDSIFGKPVISKEADVELFKIKSYKTLFNTPVNIKKNIDNGEIAKFNEKVSLIHKTLWERIDKSIRDTKKKSAPAIATYLRITANDTNHWHKQGANFVGYSSNPNGITNAKGKTTLYEYEHAMPATAAYMYLLDVSLSNGNFKPAYNAVMDNYKLIALDKAENAKLGKAKLSRGMPKGWELGKNFWWQRYFNPEVAAIEGGIPPNSIMMDNGRLMGDQLGVGVMGERTTKTIEASKKLTAKFNDKMLPPVDKLKGNFTNQQVLDKMADIDNKNVSEELKFSKSIDLSKDMNDIIEAKTGIASEKTYSRVKAEVVGANKGRFDFFISPSAEDFVGLLYKTLGKGKLGDSQMAWYKAHLLNPFARAMDNISRDRVALMNDFKALKKELKVIPKTLKKKVPGAGFTQEQAIRTYIWDKQGMTIPGMAGTDIKTLVDFVNKNPDLVVFADQLIAMQKGDQYAAPSEGWLAGSITTDLIEGINTIKRSKYLEIWQTNADQIFSEANLNKLEAAYGKDYRVALENSLQRMKTGKNRSFGGDTLTGRVTDWLTNSIGAIMFFNTRSAVLQTISAINFINFGDNNIYKAGKAFANQKQYWKDFKTLFNSDFLVERRDGLRLNVNEADIADMAKKGGVRGVISELLRLGFLPTQIADSFAIASGGSTFYRNRIKALEKQGLSTKEAETKAFQDFRETAEESQQSSRPDRISQQQAGPLGRIILAFANTPAQYARIIKKAASDLKNRRGDDKTNISKIIYYGVAQNLIFNALQQALFGLAFGDDEEELTEKEKNKKEKRYINVANGMADSLLRGMGLGGAVFSVLKNTALRLSQESEKKSPKYQDVLVKEIAQISPPISSKLGKLRQAGRSYSWNKKEMMEKGWSIDNPAYLAAGQVIAATTNIPLDRAFKKIDNIRNASNSDLEAWQRVASAAGWSAWELGIDKNKKADVKLTRSEEIFELNKKDQVDLLLKLGLTKKEINKLRLEKDRVEAIINKEKNNK